ncbi:MAG: hypothetical protein H6772_00985 [Pseudomonadales bacterium]|nr:hypothetical protein [Pseudomonadales bacterium]
MSELPTPESVNKERKALNTAFDRIHNSSYMREKAITAAFQEFSALSNKELTAKL